MGEPFMAEIRIFTCNFAPKGWAKCDGQIINIAQNTALFSLLGITYGGNGTQNFALPNLMGRAPIHMDSTDHMGQYGGEESHILTPSELPEHSHTASASSAAATAADPTGNVWANGGKAIYTDATPSVAMAPQAIGSSGDGLAHNNMSPYLALTFCIALQGIYPTQD